MFRRAVKPSETAANRAGSGACGLWADGSTAVVGVPWQGAMQGLAFLTLIAATSALSGCKEQDVTMPLVPKAPVVLSQPDPAGESRETVVISGVRLMQGNAVDCPQLRDDAGKVIGVSALSASVPIGGRVSLRGFYGVSTKCVGTVLIVTEETILPD